MSPIQFTRELTRRTFLRAGLATTLATLISVDGNAETWASIPASSSKADISHGPRSGTNVALTFHGAGDPAIANRLLHIFTAEKTPISVFAVGTWLKAHPEFAKKILDAGHDLGNHTYSHTQMKTISAKRVDSEIALCADELKKLTGNHGKWFRPSGTQYSTPLIRKTAAKYGYSKCISYDVDSHDYQDPGAAAVIANTMRSIQPGSIISLHFGHENTVAAMPALLSKIHEMGLTPVTLSTLLGA
jgi:peptidoglycan/xylan/chitin deacetylase (PgdA/CDA1 family)